MNAAAKSRNPWPIVITGFFVLFFSGLVAFAVFASRQHVDLVRADYYEQELRFQQQLDRVERTQAMPESPVISYSAAQKCITIRLPAAHGDRAAGRIHLYRPSDARLDRELELALDSEGSQRLDAARLQAGLWKVRLDWAVNGQEYYFDQPVVVGKAPRS